MGYRRICVCDNCGKSVEAYAPRGWRHVLLNTKAIQGEEMNDERVLLCSDACEADWLTKATERRTKELHSDN